MKTIRTNIKKMKVILKDNLVHYWIEHEGEPILINDWVGKTVQMQFDGEIFCMSCGSPIKKSYNQGFCYPCFITLPQNDRCFMNPELCHHHQGTCRDMSWGSDYCFSPHVLYLSLTSEPKVGITKFSHYQTRWIDQGATKAILIAILESRYQSGLIENHLKQMQFSDRTNWRVLLKENSDLSDEVMLKMKEDITTHIKAYLTQSKIESSSVTFSSEALTQIEYPGGLYPKASVSSINLDANPNYEGVLIGIKGQYLIFEDAVINLRKYGGYQLKFEVN